MRPENAGAACPATLACATTKRLNATRGQNAPIVRHSAVAQTDDNRRHEHDPQSTQPGPDGFHRIAYTDSGDAANRHAVLCAHGLSRNSRD
jgi:hypothetical protein